MRTDVLIVGGGLSGVALADRLSSAGMDYLVAEARERLGGRILTKTISGQDDQAGFDLGPAWFWPGQPRMAGLADRFGLTVFEQYADGDILAEDQKGRVQRGAGFASMAGSLRMAGGLSAAISELREQLDPSRVMMEATVTRIVRDGATIQTTLARRDESVVEIESGAVVLAMPPRVVAETITFENDLPEAALSAMRRIPTWMAGEAKIVAVYDQPFWRDQGLSGDAMSRAGPMVEIHDASPAEGGPYALFGFVGVPAEPRQAHRDKVLALAEEQLVRLFGSVAANAEQIVLQDWAGEPLTATQLDWTPSGQHPAYGLPTALAGLWDGRLIMGSTEVAHDFGGYLEGALEASEASAAQLSALLELQTSLS